MTELKEYFQQRYQGRQSFLDHVIFPIFGEESFDDGYDQDVLASYPELKTVAQATGIASVLNVGTIDVDFNPISIFDITVLSHTLLTRNRVGIQQIIRRIISTYSSAFMIFHYQDNECWDWRFTFCSKAKNNEVTDNKRYTFMLGPNQSCRTVADNFSKLMQKGGEIELKDIQQAFDVEALSDEFFGKYKQHYERFVEYVTGKRFVKKGQKWVETKTGEPHPQMYADFGCNDKRVRDYVKKLLGRIVFLHFLQKKGWMGVPEGKPWGEGDSQFMLHLYEQASAEQQADFLDTVLEPLFAGGLDTDRSEDNDLFDTQVELECGRCVKVPYLNGGLFERDALDEIPTQFPAEFFHDLLDFLYQYNFTIDENDPDDAQVGVDPEMLGRIFENLLEDNKDKGAYYTPKEIVRYMCRQSLTAYLNTGVNDKEQQQAVENFVHTYDVAFLGGADSPLAQTIDEQLKNVKICDPAIGSGAFPMGLLKELFLCRGAIENFDNAAEIKRHIIQQNIYGVDIERGAVDIARLRFWLSLVVDEETPHTLPNLDFKIMQGNSLLESYDGISLNQMTRRKDSGDCLENLRDVYRKELCKKINEYYSESDQKKKRQLIQDINKNILSQLQEIGCNRTGLSKIDLLSNDQFFLWHTWFDDVFNRPSGCNGFDIVIGNPPYISIRTKSFDTSMKDLFKKNYKLAVGQYDVYILFIELAETILSCHGVLSYIVPTRLLSNENFEETRKFLLENIPISTYANVAMPFECANVEANIMVCNRKKEKGVSVFSYNVENKKFDYSSFLDYQKIKDFPFSIFPFVFTSDVLNVFEKMQKIPNKPLKDYVEIIRGFECGYKDENIGKGSKKLIKAEAIFPYFINTNEIIPCSPDFSNSKVYKTKDVFEKVPKLVTKFCSSQIKFALDNEGFCNTNSVYNCNPNKNANISYLLGVLNSPITTFWFNVAFMNIDNLFPHIQKNQLEAIPIPTDTPAHQQKIISLVDQVLAAKKQDPSSDTAALERAIDKEVNAIYGLTPSEIAIVQGNRT